MFERKKTNMRILTLLLLMFPTLAGAVTLTLDRTIELASDSSLMAFRYRNQYQAEYWQIGRAHV